MSCITKTEKFNQAFTTDMELKVCADGADKGRIADIDAHALLNAQTKVAEFAEKYGIEPMRLQGLELSRFRSLESAVLNYEFEGLSLSDDGNANIANAVELTTLTSMQAYLSASKKGAIGNDLEKDANKVKKDIEEMFTVDGLTDTGSGKTISALESKMAHYTRLYEAFTALDSTDVSLTAPLDVLRAGMRAVGKSTAEGLKANVTMNSLMQKIDTAMKMQEALVAIVNGSGLDQKTKDSLNGITIKQFPTAISGAIVKAFSLLDEVKSAEDIKSLLTLYTMSGDVKPSDVAMHVKKAMVSIVLALIEKDVRSSIPFIGNGVTADRNQVTEKIIGLAGLRPIQSATITKHVKAACTGDPASAGALASYLIEQKLVFDKTTKEELEDMIFQKVQ